ERAAKGLVLILGDLRFAGVRRGTELGAVDRDHAADAHEEYAGRGSQPPLQPGGGSGCLTGAQGQVRRHGKVLSLCIGAMQEASEETHCSLTKSFRECDVAPQTVHLRHEYPDGRRHKLLWAPTGAWARRHPTVAGYPRADGPPLLRSWHGCPLWSG